MTHYWLLASSWLPQAPVAVAPRRGRDDRHRAALETRRVAAMRAYADGMRQVDIARKFQVSAAAVNQWVQALTAGGADALRRAVTTGRPKRGATP